MCLGTWVGFLLTYVLIHFGYSNLTPMGSIGVTEVGLSIFLNGLVSAAGVWLIHTIQEAFERAFKVED